MKVIRKRIHMRWHMAVAMRVLFPHLSKDYWRAKRKRTRLHMLKEGWECFSAEEHAMWTPGEMPVWQIIQTGPKSYKVTV